MKWLLSWAIAIIPSFSFSMDFSIDIDKSIVSANQDSRIRSLVLHFTALNLPESLRNLTQKEYQASAHYLVPDPTSGEITPTKVYQLVDEQQRAWHAGVSWWQGDRQLNASSLGIEIVNLGFPPEDQNLPPMQRRWHPFPETQINLVGALAQQLVKKYSISPTKVVGHMDIAPSRKFDPGPLFPWKRLYEEFGVGAWPDDDAIQKYATQTPYSGDILSLQKKLALYGYDLQQTGLFDGQTRNVISAFQMHFRPARYDGEPDVETVARLDALLEKYFSKSVFSSRELRRELYDSREKGDAFYQKTD